MKQVLARRNGIQSFTENVMYCLKQWQPIISTHLTVAVYIDASIQTPRAASQLEIHRPKSPLEQLKNSQWSSCFIRLYVINRIELLVEGWRPF